jgi:hypothetical protein
MLAKRTRRHLVALAVLTAATAGSTAARAADRLFEFERSGKLSSGVQYAVKIAESIFQRAPRDLPDDGSWWGIDGGFPTSLCTTFDITINGKRIDLLRKSYHDLAGLNSVEISEEKGHLVVLINGGDAAGSFNARFLFREFEVERIVRGGEFPNSRWERTIYHNSLSVDVE